MLSAPPYIPVAQISAVAPDYEWSDDQPYDVLGEADAPTMADLLGMSDRAKCCFTLGCAEWVYYRLAPWTNDHLAGEYIEAGFLGLADPLRFSVWTHGEWIWLGRVRGALATSMVMISNAFLSMGDIGGEFEGAMAVRLARHVLPDSTSFDLWREAAVRALRQQYPHDETDPLGPPVPREALDPGVNLSRETLVARAVRFAATLSGSNPFILPRTGT